MIYPIGVGMFMLVFSVLVAQKSFSGFIPYTRAYNAVMNILSENDSFARLDYSDMLMLVIFLLISFCLFKRKGQF
ncbi:hypothetical protein [Sphingobacterium siyangense]|uniref:hypothetical protein n=1 Tax=Sphingobacterium siyangense TaxID=459529 RepID=UPI002FDAE8D9